MSLPIQLSLVDTVPTAEHEIDSTDAQCTPRDLALELGVFGVDPCSNPRSHIRALKTYQLDRGEDGLALPWNLGTSVSCSVYVNGPYSNPLPWCERLARHNGPAVALWKLDPTVTWFRVLVEAGFQWAAFRKRLTFERPGNCGTANFASVLMWRDWTVPDAVAARLWIGGSHVL